MKKNSFVAALLAGLLVFGTTTALSSCSNGSDDDVTEVQQPDLDE